MLMRRGSKLAAILARVPVPLLGMAIAASALQTACSGASDTGLGRVGADADVGDADTADTADSPSQDSPADRADGMSYGDGYSR